MAREEMTAAIVSLQIEMTAEFVPFSQSRNKNSKHRSLNWRVTITRNGRSVLTADYSAGVAHSPSYGKYGHNTVDAHAAESYEIEHGKTWHDRAFGPRSPILPDLCDVLYSLALDADAIDYEGFEDWCANTGDDPDSRSAEKIYKACLETALKLRAGFGEAGLTQLREACQDY